AVNSTGTSHPSATRPISKCASVKRSNQQHQGLVSLDSLLNNQVNQSELPILINRFQRLMESIWDLFFVFDFHTEPTECLSHLSEVWVGQLGPRNTLRIRAFLMRTDGPKFLIVHHN